MSKIVPLTVEDAPALPEVIPEASPGNPAPSGPSSALVLAGSGTVSARPVDKPGRVILWQRYRERISYSSCNEDSASEVEVLVPHASKRLVSICASGGRVLNLLQDGAEEVWAVDVNPSQGLVLTNWHVIRGAKSAVLSTVSPWPPNARA